MIPFMLVQRVKNIISTKNMTASRFADHIGVPRSTISHILSGRNNPSLELVQKILDHFPELRTEWLVRGKGPMTMGSQSLFPDEEDVLEEPGFNPGNDVLPESEIRKSIKESSGKPGNEKPGSDADSSRDSGSHGTTGGGNISENRPAQAVQQAQAISGGTAINRVLVFYKDGTFETYSPR